MSSPASMTPRVGMVRHPAAAAQRNTRAFLNLGSRIVMTISLCHSLTGSRPTVKIHFRYFAYTTYGEADHDLRAGAPASGCEHDGFPLAVFGATCRDPRGPSSPRGAASRYT